MEIVPPINPVPIPEVGMNIVLDSVPRPLMKIDPVPLAILWAESLTTPERNMVPRPTYESTSFSTKAAEIVMVPPVPT